MVSTWASSLADSAQRSKAFGPFSNAGASAPRRATLVGRRTRRSRQGRKSRTRDADEMHKHCVAAGLEVTFPPTDMPWNVREMHLRHPDGHVFRVGRGFEPKK